MSWLTLQMDSAQQARHVGVIPLPDMAPGSEVLQ